VPVLKGTQISKDAENVLLDFYHGEIPDGEIDAEGLVEFCFGLHLMYAHLSQDGHIYGRMVFQGTDKMPVYIPERDEADYATVRADTVMIDESLTEPNMRNLYRSTLMHECGHSFYHRAYYDDPRNWTDRNERMTGCMRSAVEQSGKRKLSTDNDWMEYQAQYFSGAILMPETKLRAFVQDKAVRDYAAAAALVSYRNLRLSERVSKHFGVSIRAAQIRLEQLHLLEQEPPTTALMQYDPDVDYFHMMEEPKKGKRIQDILEEEFIRKNPQIEKLGLKRRVEMF